jgi:hypothetical protein
MMQIYKTNFPTEQQGKDYLLNLGVILEVEGEIVFAKNTAAVVYIGKVVDPTKTTDPDNPIFYDGFAIDVMSSDLLDFGTFEVFPADKAAHSFYGWARGAEVPPIKKKSENAENAEGAEKNDVKNV